MTYSGIELNEFSSSTANCILLAGKKARRKSWKSNWNDWHYGRACQLSANVERKKRKTRRKTFAFVVTFKVFFLPIFIFLFLWQKVEKFFIASLKTFLKVCLSCSFNYGFLFLQQIQEIHERFLFYCNETASINFI